MNRRAKSANKQIINRLKKKLDDGKESWANELLTVLWFIETTEKIAIRESPFMIDYLSETMLKVEVALHSH